jgi:CRISPR-associated protein Csc1
VNIVSISENPIHNLPSWIRLGKWAAKIQIKVVEVSFKVMEKKSGTYICSHPLNPLDLPPQQKLLLYNRVVMPPCSLISQAQLEGDYWQMADGLCLPQMMNYGAGVIANV